MIKSMESKSVKNIPPPLSFSDIESVGMRYLSQTDLFQCIWNLGTFCNYSCSYCWPHSHSSKPNYIPLKTLTNTMDKIKKKAREKGFHSFRFSFAGGEPTLQKYFLNLIRHYSNDTKNCNHQGLHIVTNLSQKIKWLKLFTEAVSPLDLTVITASFHREFADCNEFVEKIKFLAENNIICAVSIVMIPQKFDMLLEYAKFFYDHSINVYLQLQEDFNNKIVSNYTKEMIEIMQTSFPLKQEYWTTNIEKTKKQRKRNSILPSKSHIVELIDSSGKARHLDNCDRLNALNFNRYKGWECSAGYRSIIINAKGDIKRGFRCKDKPIGQLNKDFSLLPNNEPCITSACLCTGDNKIPKRRAGTKHTLYKQIKPISESPPE